MRKQIIAFICCCFAGWMHVSAQKQADSLNNLLNTAKDDTNKVNLFLALSDHFETSEPDKAIVNSRAAFALSKKLDFETGEMKSYRNLAYIFIFQSKYDSTLHYNQLAYDLAVKMKDTFRIATSLFNMGEVYKLMADYEKSLDYSLRGIRMLEGKGYNSAEANFYAGLQSTYYLLKQYDKSVEYGLKGIDVARKLDNKTSLMGLLVNMGHCYNDMQQPDKADKLYDEAIQLTRENENKFIEATALEGKVDVALSRKQFSVIKTYAERSLQLSIETENAAGIFAGHNNLGIYYLLMKDAATAKDHADTALKIARENGLLENEVKVLNLQAAIAASKNDIIASLAFTKQAQEINDKIFTTSVAQKDAEMRVSYETQKKEDQIKLQQASIRQKNTLNYILFGSALALVVIIILGYLNYAHRQKSQQRRITELETEKQLTATEAVLKGEEQERTRLAKDLHDGLGGMLSGIKSSLNTMKGNLVMTPENAQAFERSMDMLNGSIKEMRRVAHNMMPEVLVKFGLDAALKDFCNDIEQSGALKTSYQSIGLEDKKIDGTVAITTYRIVQELINNIVKHASAKTAIVQVSVDDNLLSVTVEDDGQGFDTSALSSAKGIGWSNIQHRVEFLKGRLDIHSQKNIGTSVLIELPV